jgi:DNA-binding MarR family transcriptional regulator
MARNLYLTDEQAEALIEILQKSRHIMCDEILDKLDDEKTNDIPKGVMITKIIETLPELQSMRGRLYNTKRQDVEKLYNDVVRKGEKYEI